MDLSGSKISGALMTRKGPLVNAVKWRTKLGSLIGAGGNRRLTLFSAVLAISLFVLVIFSHVAEARRVKDASELLSLNFQNAQLSKVIETLVFQRRVNIVYPPDLTMPVTARLEKVHWKDALDAILKNHGYGFIEVGNILRIDKVEKLEKEQITKEYPLNRVSAETVDPVLKGIIGGSGRYQYIPRAPTLEGEERGTLMVTASVENHDLVERALRNLAVPTGSTKPFVEGPEGGDRMSMRFVKTPVDQAMRMLCRRVGLNVVWESKPKGVVTLDVVHVKFVQALDAILVPLDYRHIQEDNSIRIMSKEAFKEAQYSRVFEMKYGLASVVSPVLLQAMGDKGTVTTIGDSATSKKILVKAPDEQLRDVERLIRSLDKPVQQILINLLIVEVAISDNFSLGIDWSTSVSMQGGSRPTRFPFGGSNQAPAPGEISFGVINASGLGGAFEALRLKSNVKVLSEPSLTTQDNQESRILVGQSYPIAVETLDRQTLQRTVTLDRYQDIGIELKVLPSICDDGVIDMRLDPKVSEVGELVEDRFPVINTREAETRVRVRHGEAAVIGGLIRTRKEKARRAVPILSKIPGIGKLFRSKRNDQTRSELLIFVVPKIIGYEERTTVGQNHLRTAPVRVLERSVKANGSLYNKEEKSAAKKETAPTQPSTKDAQVLELAKSLPTQPQVDESAKVTSKPQEVRPRKEITPIKTTAVNEAPKAELLPQSVKVAIKTAEPELAKVEETKEAASKSRRSKVAQLLAPLKKRRAEAKEKAEHVASKEPQKQVAGNSRTVEFEKTQAALLKILKAKKLETPVLVEKAKENIKQRQEAQKLVVAKAMIEVKAQSHETVGPAKLYHTLKKQAEHTTKKKVEAAVVKIDEPVKKKSTVSDMMTEGFPEAPTQKHVVAKGDTMWAIARRYGVKVKHIKEMNPQLNSIDALKIGHELVIPYDTLAAATMTPSE